MSGRAGIGSSRRSCRRLHSNPGSSCFKLAPPPWRPNGEMRRSCGQARPKRIVVAPRRTFHVPALMSPSNTAQQRPGDADRYRVLLDIAHTLAATLGEDELYQEIHRETARAVEASGFYIALNDQSGDL